MPLLQRCNRHAIWLKTVLIGSSVLAAETCAGPHNRLLRRQHCSSLCSQSEGHEHVANMVSALAHDFVGFLARVWPPQYSSPSLCEQSELQCCASDLHRMFARCPLQRRNRHAIWLKTVLIGSSVLAAEICAGPHYRLLRRQHCSSLCSQSEGHEHVANMASALAHDFVGFLARVWPPQYSPPSLCEQSELQCWRRNRRLCWPAQSSPPSPPP